jgi:hypothetical protein
MVVMAIGIWVNVRPMGFVFVLTSPQYATATIPPTVSAKHMSLNGKVLPTENLTWKVRMNEPRGLLAGANQLMLYHEGSPALMVFSFCPNNADIQDSILGIMNDQVDLGIRISGYESKWTPDAAIGRCRGIINTEEKPTGELVLYNFQQSTKHLLLKGSLRNVSTELIGKDESDTITLTIESLDFSINSPVIYEWSNKAGKTWRL